MYTNALEYLLKPLEIEQFSENFWETKHLHIRRNDRHYFSGLWTIDDVDALLSSTRLRMDRCRIAKSGKKISQSDFILKSRSGPRKVLHDQPLDTNKIFQQYCDGATIVLEFLDSQCPKLSKFCRDIESATSHLTHVNAYLTPSSAQGFGVHHDTHDVFILQVFGSKTWKIYDSAIELPLPTQPSSTFIPKTKIKEEITLRQGDLLYLPRGVQHEAEATDETSLHLTLGMNLITWKDVLTGLINLESKKNLSFRKSLPIGYAKSNLGSFHKDNIIDLLDAVKQSVSANEDFDRWLRLQNTKAIRPVFDNRLVNIEKSRGMESKSRLRINNNIDCSVRIEDDVIVLSIANTFLEFPARVAAAIDFMLTSSSFSVHEIPSLDEESKIVIASRLAQAGLLYMID